MKIILFLFIIILLGVLACAPVCAENTNKITTSINFVNVPVDQVLDIYKASTSLELVIASNVRLATHSITLRAINVSPEAVPHLLEQALLKQAGVILSRLDEKRVSVTYNDQLELQP
jgi:hypothetical protein